MPLQPLLLTTAASCARISRLQLMRQPGFSTEHRAKRLAAQLQALGFEATLEPADPPTA
ncbi:hypothetical protein [Streptomyces chrestomyceticus]|uniref:Uncharacterized protein n=1 Tax=Streptomyces chrestomyceticus TaxID=68185 RepID=A0ABU7WRW7_9ACTN